MSTRRLACLAALGGLLAGCGAQRPEAPPAPTPPLSRAPAPKPPRAWLGANYNSVTVHSDLRAFVRRGIAYDRDGNLETTAGLTATPGSQLGRGLRTAYTAGMVPIVVVDPHMGASGCVQNPNIVKLCLPTRTIDVEGYVAGFIATMRSVLDAHPGRRVLFEPMNEPWNWAFPPGTQSSRRAAEEYASVLARVLRRCRKAGISLTRIYVPATEQLSDHSSWIPDLYAAQPCLAPGPRTWGPVRGWNIHPYGLPHRRLEGIDSVPVIRRQMRSGADNIVVSEIGFCARDVDRGTECNQNQGDIVGTSAQTARWMTETLHAAAAMHRAGWLKALLVWKRAGGGWAAERPDGRLTAQGRAFDVFADSHPRRRAG